MPGPPTAAPASSSRAARILPLVRRWLAPRGLRRGVDRRDRGHRRWRERAATAAGSRGVASPCPGGCHRGGSRHGDARRVPAAGRAHLPGPARSGRARVRRIDAGAGQPLRHPQPLASLAPRLGRQPDLRDRARRRGRRRRAAAPRPHRLAVQHARDRRDAAGERLLRAGAAHAGARHRARRPRPPRVWEDWIAAVRMGVRHVRARIGAGKPLRDRRLLERRRAGA